MLNPKVANVTQLGEFDEIIDVRTPAEFAQDHVLGAINCPVLSDEERVRVGTIYKQESPFAARRIGAAIVARRIAGHIEEKFAGKPRDWKPLVYCWRGGQRSGAMTHVLQQVGWQARQLEGGYKSYRRLVIDTLDALPRSYDFRIVGGATGSGKSRLLEALAALGAQVLDLENLAAHKGSALGDLPDAAQPSQRMFENLLLAGLQKLDPSRVVYVEAESRRIGVLQMPNTLLEAMRTGSCLCIEATLRARIDFLIGDYAHFLASPASLKQKLDVLKEQQGAQTIAHWKTLVDAGDWPVLVSELLEKHYDPHYRRSQGGNYMNYADAPRYTTDDLSPAGLRSLAQRILAASSA